MGCDNEETAENDETGEDDKAVDNEVEECECESLQNLNQSLATKELWSALGYPKQGSA